MYEFKRVSIVDDKELVAAINALPRTSSLLQVIRTSDFKDLEMNGNYSADYLIIYEFK